MENKKTTELMSRKSTLKSKLMAAVSMLLVSAIMVSVTTYAWFILSTAPEVKGMSTTVGSNGALEMALRTEQDITKITSSVGDSSAKQSVVEANKTWGNLVDLTDTSYGLSGITMYPARLNWDARNDKQLASRSQLLSYAQYGTDGRIADLVPANSGTNVDGAFIADPNSYGVRAIGTATEQAPESAALEEAKNSYNSLLTSSRNKVLTALNDATQDIANIAYKHATTSDADAVNEKYTKDQMTSLLNALDGLKNATTDMETALKWAEVAKTINDSNKITTTDEIDLTGNENYTKIVALRSSIDAVQRPATKDDYTWDEINKVLSALMDVDSMKIGGQTSAQIKAMSQSDKFIWAGSLEGGVPLEVSKGLFSEAANFVDDVTSTKAATITVATSETGSLTKSAVITVKKTDGTNGTTKVDEAYLVALKTTVDGYTYSGGGNAKSVIRDKYGYAVDLAFRSNAAGELRLSGAASRVSSTNDAAILGGGCFFTADEGADANALAALRIAFVNSEDKVLAVGKLAATATEGSKYAVHLYKFEVANGVLTVTDTPIANDKLLDLTANEAVALTAVVYMDGDATSFAQGKASGSLNLQFCTSADLTAMSYNNYATAGLTFEDAITNATMGTTTSPIAAPTKILMAGKELTPAQKETVTWAGNKDAVATVDASSGAVTLMSAGEVTITATYKDNSGTHTGSYTLKVS